MKKKTEEKTANAAITTETIRESYEILNRYKSGKKNLEERIRSNHEWYRQRHWNETDHSEQDVLPSSGWLFNCIAGKHADMMDNFPEPAIRAREAGDVEEAQKLSSIIPVIMDQNGFEQVYNDGCYEKIIGGTAIYGVFWNKRKLGGLGDIDVVNIDPMSIFWEPGITDIEKSRNIFTVELKDNDLLLQQYPDLPMNLGESSVQTTQYTYDDNIETNEKSAVINRYYKRIINGRTTVQVIIFVNDYIIYASENDDERKDTGLYADGEYPFVFDICYPVKGSPAGFGFIDVGKSAQEYIDRLDSAIMKNAIANAKPRFFIKNNGGVNEKEFADTSNSFIHVEGGLNEDNIRPVDVNALPGIYLNILQNKTDELKETTGNRDVSNGGSSGATAASAIAAMQEAGSKLSRDHNKGSYRAYGRIITKVIERIREFYDLPRYFRILGEQGGEEYVRYSNENLRAGAAEAGFGDTETMREPEFDIMVSAQKASPYNKMSRNDLALQLYQAGFFNPQLSDQSLAALEMMDFEHKDFVQQIVAKNGTMAQQIQQLTEQLMQLAAIVDADHGTNMVQQMTAGEEQGSGAGVQRSGIGKTVDGGESNITRKAREETAERTAPR